MSKTSQISGDRGARLSKGRGRYINPTEPLISRVHILQTDNDSWSKALQVTLTSDRMSERAQGKTHVVVLNKPELDLDTRQLENQRTRQPGKAGHPENPVAPSGVRYIPG